MFTPQEIEEKTFVKAVFGGYDMASVDEFLEPLTEDYITLYKENAVIKSKMKILVEKLEEYRTQEDSMKKALVAAQKTSDQMIAEAEKKCAQMTSQAENVLRNKSAETQQQVAAEERALENHGRVPQRVPAVQQHQDDQCRCHHADQTVTGSRQFGRCVQEAYLLIRV